jgi:hypothetical protein
MDKDDLSNKDQLDPYRMIRPPKSPSPRLRAAGVHRVLIRFICTVCEQRGADVRPDWTSVGSVKT